jgi:hypothetical protein
MIMTQNQILLSEARFGFRYASDRVPKQRNAIPRTGCIRRWSVSYRAVESNSSRWVGHSRMVARPKGEYADFRVVARLSSRNKPTCLRAREGGMP